MTAKIFLMVIAALGATTVSFAQGDRKWNVVECSGTTTIEATGVAGSRSREASFNAVISIDDKDAIIDDGEKQLYGPTFTRNVTEGSSTMRVYRGPEGEGSPMLRVMVDTGRIELHKMQVTRSGNLLQVKTSASCKKFVPSNAFK